MASTRVASSYIRSTSASRSRPQQREPAFWGVPAPGQRRVLDPCRRELVRIVAQALLPALEQTGRPNGDPVHERVARPRWLSGEDRSDRSLGEVEGPPDELDRNSFAVAEDAFRDRSLGPPGVEPLQAGRARVLEA